MAQNWRYSFDGEMEEGMNSGDDRGVEYGENGL